MKTSVYLGFDGDCEEAMNFYAKTLGTKIAMMMRYEDAPPGAPTMPDAAKKVMHANIDIGGTLLMASDAPHGMYKKPEGMNVSLQVDSAADADRIFAALSQGGTTTMPIQKTFWAERFGMCVDRFGTPWMVNFEGQKS